MSTETANPQEESSSSSSANNSNNNNNNNNSDEPSILVTGFGPFQGIPVNPTTILVKELPDYLNKSTSSSSSEPSWKQHLASLVQDWIVMDTSAQSVCETLNGLITTTTNTSTTPAADTSETSRRTTPTLLLHLGVHYQAKGFHLEQCAYNDASFRVPDECGYQPTSVPIIESSQVTLGETLTNTLLNIPELVTELQEQFPTVKSQISTDPGRFVCNYTYCYSMYHVKRPCLFLHVPKFEVVPKEIQLEYISCLLQKMVEQVVQQQRQQEQQQEQVPAE